MLPKSVVNHIPYDLGYVTKYSYHKSFSRSQRLRSLKCTMVRLFAGLIHAGDYFVIQETLILTKFYINLYTSKNIMEYITSV
jgi:hypothetical protein